MPNKVAVRHNIKFSVVIPLYNKDGHIRSTLKSVLTQSFKDFEVVIIDDGSTDDSYKCIESIQDSRIKVFRQKNQGVSAARNRGIKEAKGTYIAFLDADDYWFPWHLEELYSLIDRYPDHGVYSVAHEIWRDGKAYLPSQPYALDFKGVVQNFFGAFSKSLALVNSTTACLPRVLLLRLEGFPEGIKHGEDIYVWLKAAIDGGLVYSSRVCARYNKDAQCRSDLSASVEIPYYLSWLDGLIALSELDKEYLEEASKFLQTSILFNAAGMRLNGNSEAFLSIKKLRIVKFYKLRILLILLQVTPKYFLRIAQRYRHAQV